MRLRYRVGSLVVLLLVAVQSIAQTGEFTLKGTVTGLPDNTLVVITDPDNPSDTLAKALSAKQAFSLKGQLKDSKLYYLGFLPAEKKALLFLDASSMQLTGDFSAPQQVKVTGSPAHDAFISFQKTFDPYFRQFSRLTEAANRTGVTDSLMKQYQSLVAGLKQQATGFADQHKTQNVAPFMWATLLQVVEDPDLVERSFQSFSPQVKEGFYGRFLEAKIAESKIGRIGYPALEFTQLDTAGKSVQLSSFRGKYVLIDFWASWCGPCRQENPNLVAAHNRFKNKNFTVLGVSLDNNREKWLKAIEADGLDWTQVSDLKYFDNEVAQLYRIQAIPQNFLVDPQGIIVAKNLRGPDLEAKLCEILGCK